MVYKYLYLKNRKGNEAIYAIDVFNHLGLYRVNKNDKSSGIIKVINLNELFEAYNSFLHRENNQLPSCGTNQLEIKSDTDEYKKIKKHVEQKQIFMNKHKETELSTILMEAIEARRRYELKKLHSYHPF